MIRCPKQVPPLPPFSEKETKISGQDLQHSGVGVCPTGIFKRALRVSNINNPRRVTQEERQPQRELVDELRFKMSLYDFTW